VYCKLITGKPNFSMPLNSPASTRFLLALIVLPILAGCFPVIDRTLKVTLAVEADGVVYEGSGIQQIVCYSAIPFLGGMSTGGCHTKGEAVFVMIGDSGPLFIPLLIDYEESISRGRPYGNPRPTRWTIPMNSVSTKMPALYRFANLNDVTTLEAVDPNDFAATYGPGVSYKSITVEQIRWGRVTRGKVIKVLPVLNDYIRPREGYIRFHNNNPRLFSTVAGQTSPYEFLGPQQ
jgi:hypothetical protein